MKYSDHIEDYINDSISYSGDTLDQLSINESILLDIKPLLLESKNSILTLESYKTGLNSHGKEVIDDFIIYCQNV